MGAIIPFNFPSDIFTHKVARAIAMGNAVVVKPSEEDPLTVAREVELLIEAGLPEGVVEVVFGGADVGAALAADDRIEASVSFTGSTEAGRSVAQSAAKRLAPVFLELGGNDAFVVLSDADVELVVEEAVFGPELSVIPVVAAGTAAHDGGGRAPRGSRLAARTTVVLEGRADGQWRRLAMGTTRHGQGRDLGTGRVPRRVARLATAQKVTGRSPLTGPARPRLDPENSRPLAMGENRTKTSSFGGSCLRTCRRAGFMVLALSSARL